MMLSVMQFTISIIHGVMKCHHSIYEVIKKKKKVSYREEREKTWIYYLTSCGVLHAPLLHYGYDGSLLEPSYLGYANHALDAEDL